MYSEKPRVSSGIPALDRRLDGLFIGDNVIWYDDAGSLAFPFALNLIRESQKQDKALIYVTFDRSPKSLIEELGPLAENPQLTILDCFTHGKGDGSAIFSKFYEKNGAQWPYQIIKVNSPADPETVADAIYGIHQRLQGDVRFVFESLTGMEDLWGGEESILKFYSRTCPRLYELETIAYWIIEKGAHSDRLKAHINQVAQVAIDLSLKSGKSALAVIKAHNRHPEGINEPELFWADGPHIEFDSDRSGRGPVDIGGRIKAVRIKRGLAQKDLAARVGVTPSTISQTEGNVIYPSIPALIRLAQTLSVDVGYFFQDKGMDRQPSVFSDGGTPVHFPDLPKRSIRGRALLPESLHHQIEPVLVEIPSGKKLNTHFFQHKGDEFGMLLAGQLQATVDGALHTLSAGDTMYLVRDFPSLWKNPGKETAKLLWIKIH